MLFGLSISKTENSFLYKVYSIRYFLIAMENRVIHYLIHHLQNAESVKTMEENTDSRLNVFIPSRM
jgi:hypothetical protein